MVPQNHRLRKVRSEGSPGSHLVLAGTTTLQHAACRRAQRTCASHASTHRTQDMDRGMACSDRVGFFCLVRWCAGCAYALPAAVSQYDQAQQAGSATEVGGATEETPTPTPRSPAAFFSRRQSLVPKLHLPVPMTPAPNSASRLSVQSSARAAVRDRWGHTP